MPEHEGKSPIIEEANQRNKDQDKEGKGMTRRNFLKYGVEMGVGVTAAVLGADTLIKHLKEKDEQALGEQRKKLKDLDAGGQAENELTEHPLSGYTDYEDWKQANPQVHPDEEKRARAYFESQAKK
ncbi:MAG TPA: twin-arginine translocation signal domain-containing protein [Patescibacteria group bacterium]|nr:twin-arginine translocation signal domain-containing protein [Patescibacteria group bacterium]